VVSPAELSKEALQKWVYRANMEFYMRPSQLWAILKQIRSWGELKANLTGGYGLLLQQLKWGGKKK